MRRSKHSAFFCLFMVALFLKPLHLWSQSGIDSKLIEAAKKEREVVWYTTTNVETSRVLADVFQKKYPYINISFYRATVGPLINRVLLEARSGKYDWDLLSGGGEMFSPVM